MKKNTEFLQYVEQYHIKNFITYHRTSEKLYKWLKAIYIVAFAYQFTVNIILILGLTFAKKPLESNIIPNTIVATVLLAVAFAVMFFKQGLISFVVNIASVCFEMTLMVPGLIMTAGVVDVSGTFYWQYAIPMFIILVVSLWMGWIAARERYIIKRDTKLLQGALYEKFGEEYISITPKQIKDFVNTYDPYKARKEQE